MNKYKAVIGLEMHCEMNCNTKVFSSAKNDFSEIPNINVRPVDMGFPGTLPTVNKEAIKKAIMAALILNCKIPEFMYFDRKNYYYPDLPKGYQITQMHNPVGVNGKIKIDFNGTTKEILIHDIHLEEDSASMDHFTDVSLINYNRAGVPLLELVTEPCIESPEEAVAFLEEMRRIYQYADISEADTKKGQIRCDVNVSIMDVDSKELGTKVEVKNVNSFSNVYETIKYEIERQSKLKDEGIVVGDIVDFDENENIIEKIEKKGIIIANVTLHVGIGTFRPVKEDVVENHKMHKEHFYIKKEDAEKINKAKKEKRRVIAVGTTSCRVLETIADENGLVKECEADTRNFYISRV